MHRSAWSSQPTATEDGVERPGAGRSVVSRQAILDAVRRSFSRKGHSSTSISEIVAQAGTSVGLPYYHFDSVIHAADSRWERQNQSLLSEYEAQTARTAAVLLGGALRAVCSSSPPARPKPKRPA